MVGTIKNKQRRPQAAVFFNAVVTPQKSEGIKPRREKHYSMSRRPWGQNFCIP
jgi:hypothetical protein